MQNFLRQNSKRLSEGNKLSQKILYLRNQLYRNSILVFANKKTTDALISTIGSARRTQRRRADIGNSSMTDEKTSALRRHFGKECLIGRRDADELD